VERTRDLARTRDRILKAALTEFAAHGLAGARCDEIARRARVNKRMLFYCFGSKEDLYREILQRKFGQRATLYESLPSDLGRVILYWYKAFSSDLQWVRLLEWEALDDGSGKLVGEQERRQYLERTLDSLRRAQLDGLVPKHLDLTQLQISIIALTAFPLAFPQMTRLASGLAPTDPRFRRKRLQFLRWLGDRLSSDGAERGSVRDTAVEKATGKPARAKRTQQSGHLPIISG
jgi:TetR/AcrR family transcriptional regulator